MRANACVHEPLYRYVYMYLIYIYIYSCIYALHVPHDCIFFAVFYNKISQFIDIFNFTPKCNYSMKTVKNLIFWICYFQ